MGKIYFISLKWAQKESTNIKVAALLIWVLFFSGYAQVCNHFYKYLEQVGILYLGVNPLLVYGLLILGMSPIFIMNPLIQIIIILMKSVICKTKE